MHNQLPFNWFSAAFATIASNSRAAYCQTFRCEAWPGTPNRHIRLVPAEVYLSLFQRCFLSLSKVETVPVQCSLQLLLLLLLLLLHCCPSIVLICGIMLQDTIWIQSCASNWLTDPAA